MKIIIIYIFLLAISKPTVSQWVLEYNFNNSLISVRSVSMVDSNYIWFSTIDSGLYGHLYKLVDGNLNNVNLPGRLRPGNIIAKDTNKVFLNSTIDIRLYYTTNSGTNWVISIDSVYNSSFILLAIANNDPDFIVAKRTVFVDSSNQYFYISTNSGLNWQVQQLNLTEDNDAYTLSITDKDHIYLGINCNGICNNMQYIFSSNAGLSWNVRYFPLISFNHEITAPVFKKDNLFGFTFSPGYDYYIYSTTNSGNNWSQPVLFFSGGTSFVQKLINIDSTSIWICAATYNVYKTTNDGVNWTLMNIPLANNERINTMDIVKRGNKYFGYIGTYFGKIYKLTEFISPIGIQPVTTEIPKQYFLSQNYPNPFNPVTKIKFGIPAGGFVKLNIFDVLGRNIKTPVNENLAAGTYEIEFDASDLPSGIYYYRVEVYTPRSGKSEYPSQVGNFIETKKMVLVK